MNVRRPGWVFLAGIVVVLAGCSSGGDGGEPRTSSSSTTTVAKFTVAEVASKVVQARSRVEKLRDDLADCPTTDEIDQLGCSFVVQRVPVDGELTLKEWSGLEGSRMPDEVAALFNQTYSAAQTLSYVEGEKCADGTLNADCSTVTYAARRAVDDLLAKMDGWGPYS